MPPEASRRCKDAVPVGRSSNTGHALSPRGRPKYETPLQLTHSDHQVSIRGPSATPKLTSYWRYRRTIATAPRWVLPLEAAGGLNWWSRLRAAQAT